ncbi:MAG: sulfatase [Planctomycetes bacterium]|nr:sulfatase [Planctomycetota bacterium]
MLPPRLLAAVALTALLVACGDDAPNPSHAPRTVVLVSLDTLRPERLGVYGGHPDTSPAIDALASESVVFDQVLAASPWTLPSHMTMLTGLDPVAHGVRNAGYRLSRNVTTLAESLQAAGFTTGAFTDGGFVDSSFGFDQGFATYDDARSDDGPNGMLRIVPRVLSWLDERDAGEDVFLFVHTFDAHTPYDSPGPEVLERFRARPVDDGPDDWMFDALAYMNQQVKTGVTGYARLSELLNDYDAGVHVADTGVGRIVEALRAAGRWDDALLIVTSDHGESFLDHGLHVGHGLASTDDELHVPLLLKLPRGEGAGTRRPELVGLVDVARTVLDVTGVAPDPITQGESLLGLVRGIPRSVDFVLGASQNATTGFLVRDGLTYVTPTAIEPMRIAQRHLGPSTPPDLDPSDDGVEYTQGNDEDAVTLRYDVAGDPLGLSDVLPGPEMLFDRAADPGERHDVARERPDDTKRMRTAYQKLLAESQAVADQLFDEEAGVNEGLDREQERLLATLGYIGGSESAPAIPMKMRTWALTPPERPDTSGLVAAARAAYVVEARLREGGEASPDDAATLQDAALRMASWAGENPDFAARVEWRLVALTALAEQHGLQLEPQRWLDAVHDAARAAKRGKR